MEKINHVIRLPIDTKSLYYNIFNDNLKGHTCTVATPIKQGKSVNIELNEIYKIPEQINFLKYDGLCKELTKNSKSIVRITNVFVFDKIKLNGRIISCPASFCIYIKEEVDPNRIQYGRIKMHYPLSLKYDELNINNKIVINTISSFLYDHAFVVEGFEYSLDDGYLDIKTLIVGYNNIPYSKVFLNNKGVGLKYNYMSQDYYDLYDMEIPYLRKKFKDQVDIYNFNNYMQDAKIEALRIVKKYLVSHEASDIEIISDKYPCSLFDIKYNIDGNEYYLIVKFTFTKFKYIELSFYERRFISLFLNSKIILITDIMGNNKINIYDNKDIDNLSINVQKILLKDCEE